MGIRLQGESQQVTTDRKSLFQHFNLSMKTTEHHSRTRVLVRRVVLSGFYIPQCGDAQVKQLLMSGPVRAGVYKYSVHPPHNPSAGQS